MAFESRALNILIRHNTDCMIEVNVVLKLLRLSIDGAFLSQLNAKGSEHVLDDMYEGIKCFDPPIEVMELCALIS